MNIRAKIFGGAQAAADEPPVIQPKAPKGSKADALDSVAVKRQESRTHNNRIDDRHRLRDEQASVVHDGTSHIVELVNVSGGGAMVKGDFRPALWDRVELRLGENGAIECAVVWLRGDRIGLEFAHETRLECSPDEQAKVLRDVIVRSFPDLHFEVSSEAATEKHAGPEQRAERRHPLIWSGVLHHDYQSTPVRLRNVSATGALVECTAPVRVGSEPLLELSEAIAVSVTVSWAVGDQVGLKFHTPFDMALLARAQPEVAPAHSPAPAYLKGAPASGSPWAEHWGRMSIGELRDELEGYLKR